MKLQFPFQLLGLVVVTSIFGLAPQEQVRKLIARHEAAEAAEPANWRHPFAIGQAYKHKLMDCASALVAYERAIQKSSHTEFRPIIEAWSCLKKQGDESRILYHFDQYLSQGGKIEDEKHRESAARLFAAFGRPERVLELAKEGTQLYNRHSAKIITIQMRIGFVNALKKHKSTDADIVRLAMPLERAYQKLLSWSIVPVGKANGFTVLPNLVQVGENRYAELRRSGAWPQELDVRVQVEQSPVSLIANGTIDAQPVTNPTTVNYAEATHNPENWYSLDDPDFVALASQIVEGAASSHDKVVRLLDYERAHFRHAPRLLKRSDGAYKVLKSGQGDCGYFSFVAMALLRTQRYPTRFLYGMGIFSAGNSPHAIIEVFDKAKSQWIPIEPQSKKKFGASKPNFVVFTTAIHKHGTQRIDGILHFDTPRFHWDTNGRVRPIEFSVLINGKEVHSVKANGPATEMEPSERRSFAVPED